MSHEAVSKEMRLPIDQEMLGKTLSVSQNKWTHIWTICKSMTGSLLIKLIS